MKRDDLILLSCDDSERAARDFATQLHDNFVPFGMSLGLEIEGGLYDEKGSLVDPVTDGDDQILSWHHAEYMTATLETASEPVFNKELDSLAVAAARATAQLVLDSVHLAKTHGALIVYASTFESGNWGDMRISHAPEVRARGIEGKHKIAGRRSRIPEQTLQLYRHFVPNVDALLRSNLLIPWPVHAMHVHSGLPTINGISDIRLACLLVLIRNSVAAKLLSFVLFNTCTALGCNLSSLGIFADARAVFRRFAPTSWGFFCPRSHSLLQSEIINACEPHRDGSAFRVSESAAHDRVRLRFGSQQTVESVDASMTPDLRAVISWILFTRVLDGIAIDFLVKAHGDEVQAAWNMENSPLFRPLPTMGGTFSSCHWDVVFNRYLWDGIAPGLDCSFREAAHALVHQLGLFSKQSSAFSGLCDCISLTMLKNVGDRQGDHSVLAYLGVERGHFEPGHGGIGPISMYKAEGPPATMVADEARATELQAKTLANVRDMKDLLVALS